MRSNLNFAIVFFLLLSTIALKAQVTIGSGEKTAEGAVLQLKQWTPSDPNIDNSNSHKGLGLPRVALKSITSLEPFLDPNAPDYEQQKILHQGLMVLNINKNASENLEFSPYTWDGAVWKEYLMKPGEQKLNITPNISLYEFDPKNPVPVNIKVEWSPSFIPCSLIQEYAEDGGLKGLEIIQENTDVSGNYTFTIAPTAMTAQELEENPFLDRHTTFHIRASDGAGKFLTKTLNLNQTHYSLRLMGLDPYMEMGREYSLNVASNAEWKLTIIDPTGDAFDLQEIPTNGAGAVSTSGTTYKIKLKNEASIEGVEIQFKFTSPEGKFTDKIYTFKPTKTYPNTYIIKPGDTQEIPLNKAYIVWANDMKLPISETADFEFELVWQDTLSLVNSISKLGTGINTKIIVETQANVSEDGGNAVVAAKLNGKTCWSWHLWVTKYNPNLTSTGQVIDYDQVPTTSSEVLDVQGGKVYSYFNSKIVNQFMDRDLGTLRICKGIKEANMFGTNYQFGRKDPFPGADIYAGNYNVIMAKFTMKPLYSIDNTTLVSADGVTNQGITGIEYHSVEAQQKESLMQSAIENPRFFFYPEKGGNDFDWYGSFVDCHGEEMWVRKDGTKGYYDPCPEGWRVPVSGLGADHPLYGIPFSTFPDNVFSLDTGNYLGQIVYGGSLDIIGIAAGTNSHAGYGKHTSFRSATEVDARSYISRFSIGSIVSLSNMDARGHGSEVRCVKE